MSRYVVVKHLTAASTGVGPPSVHSQMGADIALTLDHPEYRKGWGRATCACGNGYEVLVLDNHQRRQHFQKERRRTLWISLALLSVSAIVLLVLRCVASAQGIDFSYALSRPGSGWNAWFEGGVAGIVFGLMGLMILPFLRANEVLLVQTSGESPSAHIGYVR